MVGKKLGNHSEISNTVLAKHVILPGFILASTIYMQTARCHSRTERLNKKLREGLWRNTPIGRQQKMSSALNVYQFTDLPLAFPGTPQWVFPAEHFRQPSPGKIRNLKRSIEQSDYICITVTETALGDPRVCPLLLLALVICRPGRQWSVSMSRIAPVVEVWKQLMAYSSRQMGMRL